MLQLLLRCHRGSRGRGRCRGRRRGPGRIRTLLVLLLLLKVLVGCVESHGSSQHRGRTGHRGGEGGGGGNEVAAPHSLDRESPDFLAPLGCTCNWTVLGRSRKGGERRGKNCTYRSPLGDHTRGKDPLLVSSSLSLPRNRVRRKMRRARRRRVPTCGYSTRRG